MKPGTPARGCPRPATRPGVLAGLSDQATSTGHPDHGLQLAKTGRVGLQQHRSASCLARLHALQARAEAAMGDGKATAHSIAASERAFERADPDNEPEWARFIDRAYLNGEYAHAFRDLRQPKEAAQRYATSSNSPTC